MKRQQQPQEHDPLATRERWTLAKGALNVTDAACYMSVRERLLMDMANRGEIPYVKIGRDYLFLPDQLDKWLRDHSTTSTTDSDTSPMRPSQPMPQEPSAPWQRPPLKRGMTPGRQLG
jgi:excisionase family DNA binding protein